MLATLIVVFREVLEAALIVSIVMAACKGLTGRNTWVTVGIAGGVLGAGLVAAFASTLAAAAQGMGQELFNAGILLAAVLMLSWHSVWMARHGRELAQQAGEVSAAVMSGARPLYAIAVVIGVAVLREGSETVLFIYGIATSAGADSVGAMLTGAALGVLLGVVAGATLYFGLLRIPVRHLFTVTNWLIVFLAAGLASQAAGFLVQADLLPSLGDSLWDTSWLLNESSLLGKVLHTLIGYVARPAGIQILFYLTTLLAIVILMRVLAPRTQAMTSMNAAVIGLGALVAGAISLGFASDARADFQVRSPIVDYREIEFELNGSLTVDRRADRNRDFSETYSIGAGLTPYWLAEIEAETQAAPGTSVEYAATTLETTVQLTPQGKYWADASMFAEYSRSAVHGDPDTLTFGPLVQKETQELFDTPMLHTANVLFERELGASSTDRTGFSFAWQSRFRLDPLFEPGIEYYAGIDDLGHAGSFDTQAHRIGPVVAGLYAFPPYGKIKYQVGYLFGLNNATEDGALRWRLEYEIPF